MNDTSNVGVNSVPQANSVPVTPVSPQPVQPAVAPAPVAAPAQTVVAPQAVAPATPVVAPAPVQPSEPVVTNPVSQTPSVSANVAAPAVSAPVVTPVVTPVAPVATPAQPAQAAPQAAAPAPVAAPQPAPVAAPATPVVAPAPAPVPTAPAVEAPKEESKVEVQIADNIKIDSEKIKEKKKKEKKEKRVNDDDDGITVKANRYPIILAVVFVSLLLLLFVYYYLVMTPYNVFDSALSSMVEAVKDGVNNFGEDDSERNQFDLQFELQTDTEQFKNNPEQTPIDYINGDHIQGIVNFDTVSKGFSLNLLADKAVKNLPAGVTPSGKKKNLENMLDLKFYSFNDNMYIGPIYYIDYNDPNAANMTPIDVQKTVQVSLGLDGERALSVDSFTIDSLKYGAELIDLIIEKGKTTVYDSDLKRSIVFKKVGDSTAIALKANCDTHEEMVDRVFHGTFDDEFINRKEVIDLTMKTFGIEENDAKELLLNIHNRPIDFTHLDINLYMNLANTELISFDMTFDETVFIEVDYLKGFYSIIVRIMDKDNKDERYDKLNIRADYDRDNGVVDGLGIINNDNTFLAVKFDYNRKITAKGEKVGNNLNFKFYNNKTYLETDPNKQKPFCRLDCTLDIYESNKDPNKEHTNFDLEKEVENAYILPVSQYKTSSGLIIKSTLTGREKITAQEGVQIINFEKGITSHIQFLVDHLLYNKEGAIARRDNKSNEFTETQNVEENSQSTETIEKSETEETVNENTEETTNETSNETSVN